MISCQNLEREVHSLIRRFLLNSKYNLKRLYNEEVLTLSGKVSDKADLGINFHQ